MSRRILLVGRWQLEIYEEALSDGFRACGCEVVPVAWKDYIRPSNYYNYVQSKLLWGPDVLRLNKGLIKQCQEFQPDIIVLHKNLFIWQGTLERIKSQSKTILVSYNNDNPFAWGKWSLWRHYLKSIRSCHINLFYRPSNVEHAKKVGIANPKLFLSYYVEGLHRPREAVPEQLCHDVVFVGHYERDNRADILEYLLANGISVRVYGTNWNRLSAFSPIRKQDIRRLGGKEYAEAISGSKIAIVFLSQLNKDVYTRRCFEIPACGTLMMVPDNAFLRNLFEEDVEAVFYTNKKNLLRKIQYYLQHHSERKNIALAGRNRVLRDRHDNISRARQILSMAEGVEVRSAPYLSPRAVASD